MIIETLNRDTMPRLGFGLMRLPEKDGEIDLSRVNHMVDAYMKKGFCYFDTAYVYHSGKSEKAVKEILVNRYAREDFLLATKLPCWELHKKEDVERVFKEQLDRTGASYFDFYLLHSIEKEHLKVYDQYDCWNWGVKKKEEGLIRHFGFSFHGDAVLLEEILKNHPEAEFVQLQINYADWEDVHVQSKACYQVAEKYQVPVIVMEPVKGGTLAAFHPDVEAALKGDETNRSAASFALRFAASLPNVMTTLSGMSTEEQMEDNLNTMHDFVPLSEKEREQIEKALEICRSHPLIPCTGCGYCVDGCPAGIRIPNIFRAVNHYRTFGNKELFENRYQRENKEGHRAEDCIACGKCKGVCPQHLDIPELMRKIAKSELEG